MIKAIIFDFFGVIVGDEFDSVYRAAGGDPEKDRLFIEEILAKANRAQISREEFRQQVIEKLGISAEEYSAAFKEGEAINYDLLNYIKTLRPKYKTAILSNVNKGGLERRLSREFLQQYFDAVIISGEVGYIKPEAEIYQLTAERLEAKVDECVFIDDREPYVDAAQNLGMKTIEYQTFEQTKAELEKILAGNGPNN